MSYELFYREFLRWLREDIPEWDLTTEAVRLRGVKARGRIVCKSGCVAACVEEVAYSLERLGLSVELQARSGEWVEPGSDMMLLVGDAATILEVERVTLNTLIYACSIATTTRRLVEMVRRVNPRVRVAATRKTVPGFRYCSKRAVEAGGGDTHRLTLSDAILVKDNHVALIGSVGEAVRRVVGRKSFVHRVEVEVHNVEEALAAVETGADAILIDNQPPSVVRAILEELEKRGLRDRVVVEVSGGITSENILEYARLNVDVISTSFITMSPERVDISLVVEPLDNRREGGSPGTRALS
ncbi:nicotinate-nucleotide pyrophosphorylase [Pyrolobus fumarii 1A]|uniref:Nicotinate-nucleotide pyrophosphorylase [carboxylating] n=1 Tax=Pyrolobus fumarii (strain DSM 11204 / 1A) TaxID=694429 RepID=G0EFT4_PYRF1|nr:carboxylating nicotinate-nucleotide diphosphorylase [Pyrolobus fumarii]AEM38255.1 nicotinate-nucleotide pyrophosphorylase [Pyrolobus fumarii 1A]